MTIFVLVIQFVSASRAMMSRFKFVLLQCLLVSYVCFASAQSRRNEGLAFPETIEDTDRLPSDNREPLYMQTVCQENELYYPGDQNDDWICDCKPGYIYFGALQKCFPAFERGPCTSGKLLMLDEDGHTPRCTTDVCASRNRTRFGNECVKIGAPCDRDTRRVYGVNEKTIKVECLPVPNIFNDKRRMPTPAPTPTPISVLKSGIKSASSMVIESRMGEDEGTQIPRITDPEKRCLPGCHRKQSGICTEPHK